MRYEELKVVASAGADIWGIWYSCGGASGAVAKPDIVPEWGVSGGWENLYSERVSGGGNEVVRRPFPVAGAGGRVTTLMASRAIEATVAAVVGVVVVAADVVSVVDVDVVGAMVVVVMPSPGIAESTLPHFTPNFDMH